MDNSIVTGAVGIEGDSLWNDGGEGGQPGGSDGQWLMLSRARWESWGFSSLCLRLWVHRYNCIVWDGSRVRRRRKFWVAPQPGSCSAELPAQTARHGRQAQETGISYTGGHNRASPLCQDGEATETRGKCGFQEVINKQTNSQTIRRSRGKQKAVWGDDMCQGGWNLPGGGSVGASRSRVGEEVGKICAVCSWPSLVLPGEDPCLLFYW